MLLYIHGFASSANSNKAKILKKEFDDFVSIDLDSRPQKAIKQLRDVIENSNEEVSILGSSLGGYYALYLNSIYNIKTILINPSIKPYITLNKYRNRYIRHFTKNSGFFCDKRLIDDLNLFRAKVIYEKKILLMVQKGDKELDYREALRLLPNSKKVVEENGNHKFENFENKIGEIREFIL